MKAIVCGGRNFSNATRVFKVLDAAVERLGITEIVQGGAKGADYLAWQWANVRKVPCKEYRADWDKHGDKAGPIRNRQMLEAETPDLVIAFEGGDGTQNMIDQATRAGVRVIRC